MAQRINKRISKLSILFVLSILIPGSILVYFSIQNIVSQKELTEKRLIEEENEIATDLAEYFQLYLSDCATTFFNRVDSLALHFQKDISILDSLASVRQVFILDKKGGFIWPHFLREARTQQKYLRSQRFAQALAAAEKSEFAKSNPTDATRLYREALKAAKNEAGLATATNGLARALAKRGLIKQAQEQYRVLAKQYGSIVDDNGLPFGHYALHQLIRFSSRNQSELIVKDIDAILSSFLNGEIPLTKHTDVLLQEVSNWLKDTDDHVAQTIQPIAQDVKRIRELLSFASQHGSSLRRYIADRDGSVSRPKLGDFEAVIESSGGKPSLLLLDRVSDKPDFAGFEVDLDGLREEMLAYAVKSKTSFDFKIDIVYRDQTTQVAGDPLTTTKELSPLVPSWRTYVSTKDPEIINSYIAKRRLVYGIGLVFLIAGMSFGVVLVLRDVSRERRLAQLRTDFVSNVSHELKTPLTSIRMLAETMRLGRIRKKSEVQEYLSMIVSESERLSRLINTVLDFSKIDQGNKRYDLQPTNLSEVLQAVIGVMEKTMNEKGFDLKTDIAPNVQTVADADAIEQAMLNLVSNAIKYSRERKEISIRLWANEQSIYAQVADKGVGIPASEQKRIFEKFYQAHIGHEHDTGGAGLGLTVVKHILDGHDGKIELESKVGAGSTFTIILPQKHIDKGEEI